MPGRFRWLSELKGPGYYGRLSHDMDARAAYNHLQWRAGLALAGKGTRRGPHYSSPGHIRCSSHASKWSQPMRRSPTRDPVGAN